MRGIQPPSSADILRPTNEQRLKRLNLEVTKGNLVKVVDQGFQGYSFCPKTLEEVNIAYAKIRAIHAEARHVVGVCRLPGRNFHTNQDYCDDNDHNAGNFLLNLLSSCEIQKEPFLWFGCMMEHA